jgi:nicotinamidase/pyrazinamidase
MKLYFDIDTQIDFLFPSGALYVAGAEKLIPAIARLNREAVEAGNKLISTADAHAEDDPEFRIWPAHCVKGTVGQMKPAATLVGQPILEKQELNLFSNPEAERMIREIAPEECVVYGVVTEYCVKLCAMGLLERGYKVRLLENAIERISEAEAAEFLREFRARGGVIAKG